MSAAAAPRPNVIRTRAVLARLARTSGNAGAAHLLVKLYGDIGEDRPVSLKAVRAQLAAAPYARRLRVLINSAGGSVDEAQAIYTALREHPAEHKSATVISQCASAAVLPFLAADHRALAAGAEIMIHAASFSRGGLPRARLTARQMRRYAEMIARADDGILAVLAERTGSPRSYFAKAMQDDRPMRAVDALRCGLVHEVTDCPASRPCDPAWPARAHAMLTSSIVGLPAHLFTENYLAACRAAPKAAAQRPNAMKIVRHGRTGG